MKERTKDVQIGDRAFQVTGFSPRRGNWVAGQFLIQVLLQQLSTDSASVDEKKVGAALAATMTGFEESIYARVQAECFAVASEYNAQKIAMPVVMRDGPRKGEWAGEPLDLVDSLALTVSVLVFNLYDFFAPGARAKLLAVFPDLSAQTDSTPTSSGQ